MTDQELAQPGQNDDEATPMQPEDVQTYANMGTLSGLPDIGEHQKALCKNPPDRLIYDEIRTILSNDPLIDYTSLEVHVKEGMVMLQGIVYHQQMLRTVSDRVAMIAGVKSVDNQMQVRAPLIERERQA